MLKLAVILAILAVGAAAYIRFRQHRRRAAELERQHRRDLANYLFEKPKLEPVQLTPANVRTQPRRADGKFASYADYQPPLIVPAGIPAMPTETVTFTDHGGGSATVSHDFSGGGGGDFGGGGDSGSW